MRFNRRITAIKAISFDLDDTLYSNRQVMINTDAAMQTYFQQLAISHQLSASPAEQFNHLFWLPFRQQALTLAPELSHDVTEARRHTYRLGFQQLGMPVQLIEDEVSKAMHYFLSQRNKVAVPNEIHQFLSLLSKKFPLVAISNGNVDTKVIGLEPYFQHIFHAGNGFKQKPDSDLFHAAIKKLKINAKQLLHVGDCGNADIKGANRAGCQSAWLNCYDVGQPITQLADIELNQVTELAQLLLPVTQKIV
ncbi:MAG: HAD-IA family hydrolase [Thalassotalea sp.]